MNIFKVFAQSIEEICETATTIGNAKRIAAKFKKDTNVEDICITDYYGNVLVRYYRIDSGYGKPKWVEC